MQPASWVSATHSAAEEQGYLKSSFPWHLPSAGGRESKNQQVPANQVDLGVNNRPW